MWVFIRTLGSAGHELENIEEEDMNSEAATVTISDYGYKCYWNDI